jgi:hypothetical protein
LMLTLHIEDVHSPNSSHVYSVSSCIGGVSIQPEIIAPEERQIQLYNAL